MASDIGEFLFHRQLAWVRMCVRQRIAIRHLENELHYARFRAMCLESYIQERFDVDPRRIQ